MLRTLSGWLMSGAVVLSVGLPTLPADDTAKPKDPVPAKAEVVKLAKVARQAALKENVRVAIVGDSITEQRLYSKYVAAYLYGCMPQLKPHVVQFGWSGEKAVGFAARVENDVFPFKPDVVTTCYGMNDGEYRVYSKDIGDRYSKPLREAVRKLKDQGATVVVGSPGAVDQYFFQRRKDESISSFSATYNDNLAHLGDLAKTIAEENQFPFANVHDTMHQTMLAAQKVYGNKYNVCGNDGFHPGPNGQLLMAYAFLRTLQLDGDLGTITVDMGEKSTATATNGHKVLETSGGTITLESTRYPFSFFGEAKSPAGTRSIVDFTQFNEELNRLTLKVSYAPAAKMKVQWGDESHTFTKEELAKGVNLAAVFQKHPLVAPFQKMDQAITEQQNLQTYMIKEIITKHRTTLAMLKNDAELAKAQKALAEVLWAKEAEKHAAVQKTVVPVKHTLTITPE
ncbi:MAG: SGNH/GDSL hydrolase family protein [Gemmataceae bacterium]